MSQTNVLGAVEIAEDAAHDELFALFTEVLDAHYENTHSGKAFGMSGEARPQELDVSWILGRNDDDEGVGYVFRAWEEQDNRGRLNEEKFWVYGGYGWADLPAIAERSEELREPFEEAVDRYDLDESILARYDAIINTIETGLYNSREDVDLPMLADLFRSGDLDTLRPLLGADDEDRLNLWTILHSKDENGEVLDNPLETPVCDDEEGLMLVRSERYFHDEHREPDGKWYTVGHVVGYDDTPDQFFMHRLESDADLRDPETEWTVSLLREKMGFDMEYPEWLDAGKPTGERVRIQGDVAFVRHDYSTKLWEHYDDLLDTRRQQLVREHKDALLEEFANTTDDVRGVQFKTFNATPRVTTTDTDRLKTAQDALDISEDAVRAEQNRQGIARLSGKRRGEIVESLLFDRVYASALSLADTTAEAVEAEIECEAKELFTETQTQENLILGNHTIIVGPAQEHPDRDRAGDDGALSVLCVPGEANGYVWHDEHENKKLALPQGVYEFRFLSGHETQWWMSN
jgi:hypothetical protein